MNESKEKLLKLIYHRIEIWQNFCRRLLVGSFAVRIRIDGCLFGYITVWKYEGGGVRGRKGRKDGRKFKDFCVVSLGSYFKWLAFFTLSAVSMVNISGLLQYKYSEISSEVLGFQCEE